MITKEMVEALRKEGLGAVCEMNGKFMWNDGRELSPSQLELVEKIARADKPLVAKAAKASPSPPAKPKKPIGRPPKAGGKDK
jgi:hypothetical protein